MEEEGGGGDQFWLPGLCCHKQPTAKNYYSLKEKYTVSHFHMQYQDMKRFFLSYEKGFPFEMAKFFPSADGKNFCHFIMKSVIPFSI